MDESRSFHLAAALVAYCMASVACAAPVLITTAGPANQNVVGNCIVNAPNGSGSTARQADVVCGDANGANHGFAAASVGHVGATATATSFGGQISENSGQATYSDTVVFTGPGATVQTSLNLHFGGILNSALSTAQVRGRATVGGIVVGEFSYVMDATGALFECRNSFINSFGCGAGSFLGDMISATVEVPVGTEVGVVLDLFADAGSSNIGGSARAEFANSLDFVTGSSLFNLQAGYSVNSTGSFIVDNRFLPNGSVGSLPEPSSLLLMLSGMVVLLMRQQSRA